MAVSLDRICEEVWEGAPTPGARSTVKTYVSQMRRLFATQGGPMLRSNATTYQIEVADDFLDAARFARQLGSADADTDVTRRLGSLDDALALWRGPALAEVAHVEWAQSTAASLDAARLRAQMLRADTLLELGRLAEALPELERLAIEHPLDEAAAMSLASARYHAGNQAGALRALGEAKRRLATDLGLTATNTLTDLEQRILHHGVKPLPARDSAPTRTTTPRLQTDMRAPLEPPNNLPLRIDALVGRQREIRDVEQELEHHRLVTLIGAGGAGKTRLAIEVAARQPHRFADGVWLVQLAQLDNDDRVAAAAATVLNVGGRQGVPIEGSLVEWLRTRHLLLVLDNCEHVLDGAAALATGILQSCPHVHVMATSRELLGVRGEQLVAVPPLPVKPEAEELFEVRARSAAPDAELDRALVARVCRRLDGLPLAIELAAARLRGLSLADLAERLDDRFCLLVSGLRGELPHHRTLEAVVAWSYDLLSETDQLVFTRCSLFADSFDLAAAVCLARGDAVADTDVVDAMSRLVDKSLVIHTTDQDGRTRYRLLETLRQYGRDRLAESGDVEHRRNRLSDWAMACIEVLERHMRTPRQDAALRHINPDRANLRWAFDRAIEHHDYVSALRIVSAVPVALPSERRELIAWLTKSVGDGHTKEVAQAHLTATNLALEQGDWHATVEEGGAAAEGFAAIGDRRLASWSRYFQSFGTWGLGDGVRTDKLLDELLEEFRGLGDEFGLAYTLWLASQRQPDLAQADLLAAEADGLLRALGARFALAHNLEGRALIAIQAQQLERAPNHLREALLILADAGNMGCTAHCLEAIGLLLAEQHRPLTAVAELVGAAEALRETSEHQHRPWELRGHHAVLAELDGTPDHDAIDEARSLGRAHDFHSAVQRAERLLSEPAPTGS